MAVLNITSSNSMETRELTHIKNFYNKFPRQIFVGETGIPHNQTDARWDSLMRKTVQAYLHMGGSVTMWGGGANWGNYEYAAYTYSGGVSTPSNSGRILEEFLPTYSDRVGLAIAGLEFAGETPNSQQFYNSIAARGIRFVRISFHWNRVQPALNGPLTGTSYNNLKNEVQWAKNAGITRIIICAHNYGCYSSSRDGTKAIGNGQITEAHFQDLWRRMSLDPVLGAADIEFDTMNEPVMVSGSDPNRWSNIAINLQNYLNSLNSGAGIPNRLWFEGWNWAGVQDAPSMPANSNVNSVHDYKDISNGGFNTPPYDTNNSQAASQGFAASQVFTFDNAGIETPTPPAETGTVITSSNVVEARAMRVAKGYVDWLNGKKGLIGEFGIPWQYSNGDAINTTDRAKWLSLGNKVMAIWNDNDINATMWGGGKASGVKLWGSYQFTAWEDNQSPFTARWNSALYTNADNYESINFTTAEYLRGLNISGAEFGFAPAGDGGAGNRHSADNLTADWTDTYGSGYPTATEFEYFNDLGLKLIRIPVRAEKLWPTLNSATFNSTELAALEACIAAAAPYTDIKLIIDIHNYGAFLTGASSPYTTNRLGQGWTVAAYKAQLLALVNTIKDYDNFYAIDIMNEPSQIYTTGTTDAQKGSTWETYSSDLVNHLRTNGYTGMICVPTADWSGAHTAPSYHPNGPWITDANILWECHHYWDKDANGDVPASETWAAMETAMSGEPQQSYTVRFTAAPIAPIAPSDLVATAESATRISLVWSDNSSTEESFKVQRKQGDTGTWQTIATVGANVETYVDQGLSQNTLYYYRVAATNSAGDSAFTDEANATTKKTGRVAVGELTLRPIFARRQ